MGKVCLTLAIGDYDHVRDLASGRVTVEGVALRVQHYEPSEIFHRQQVFAEWDVAEMSLAQHAARVAGGDNSLVGIPVFPSRVFRHSNIFVRAAAGIEDPRDLEGARVGVPEWAQTAVVYVRGFLAEQYGVDLTTIRWIQGGVEEAGRTEHVPIAPPEGFHIDVVKDRTLDSMLVDGSLDAIIAAYPPPSYRANDGQTIRLIKDSHKEAIAHWQSAKVFPIMHLVTVRADVVEKYPWLLENLCRGFDRALKASLDRMAAVRQSIVPMPLLSVHAEWIAELMGQDWWPYGLEANMPTLEAFIRYGADHGVWNRQLSVRDLFAPQSVVLFRR